MENKVNQEILKKYFSGLYGLVPNKPKEREPLTGNVSDSRLVKKITPTYPYWVGWFCYL